MKSLHFFPIQIVTCLLAAFLLTACNGINTGTNSGTHQYKDYKQAVKENDFEAAHDFLEEIYDEFLETWNDNYAGMNYNNDNRANIEAAATKYSQAATYVLSAEARYIIANFEKEAPERIGYLFNEIRIMGEKSDHYAPGGVEEYQQECAKVDCYMQTANCFNQLCDVILNLAILNHNKKLADLALSYYREKGKVTDSWECTMEWYNDDKNAAQERYDKAVADGVFDDL